MWTGDDVRAAFPAIPADKADVWAAAAWGVVFPIMRVYGRYPAGVDGTPREGSEEASALSWALQAQIAAWQAAGYDPAQPAAAGGSQVVASKRLGPATITYAGADEAAAAKARVPHVIADAALSHLRPYLHQPVY